MSQARVFGIGFHKTGTLSLHHAFGRVGLKSIHFLNRYKELPVGLSRAEVLEILAPALQRHDAFVDVPFPALYVELDRMYPGSRFVLTRRSGDSWWHSLVRHWALDLRLRRLGAFEWIQYNRYQPRRHRVSLGDRDLYVGKFDRHNQAVVRYFQDRPGDLLVIDWQGEEHAFSWETFCGFLELDLPEDRSVPWYNRSRRPGDPLPAARAAAGTRKPPWR